MDFYDEAMGERVPSAPRRHARKIDPDQAIDIERRLAAMAVRRMCNQHQCTGESCVDTSHRKDADYLLSENERFPGMLDMLGLPREYPDLTEQDRLVWLKWLRQAGPPEDAGLEDAA